MMVKVEIEIEEDINNNKKRESFRKEMAERGIKWEAVKREGEGEYGLIDSNQFRRLDELVKEIGIYVIGYININRDGIRNHRECLY